MFAIDVKDKMYYEEDFLLVKEVLKCIDTEAYRSAYIMTWVAIAESILLRFKKMSKKDYEIGKLLKDVEGGKIQSVDSDILNQARGKGLVNEIAYKKLKNILDMRNKYAHPTNIAPQKYEVLSALEIAIEEIFSHKAYIRKGYIVNLIGSFINDNNFCPHTESSINEFVENLVNNVQSEDYTFVLNQIVKQLEPIIKEGSKNDIVYKSIDFIDKFLAEVKDYIDLEDIEIMLNTYQRGTCLALSNGDVLNSLSDGFKSRLINVILNDGIKQFIALMRITNAIETGLVIDNDILSLYDTKIKEIVEKEGYFFENKNSSHRYNKIVPIKYYIDKAKKDLLSGDFPIQNLATYASFEILFKEKSELKNIDKRLICEIGSLISNCAPNDSSSYGSHDARDYILKLRNHQEKLKFDFIKGIFVGVLYEHIGNSDITGYLWVKDYYFDSVFLYLTNNYSIGEVNEACEEVIILLNQDKVEDWRGGKCLTNAIKGIEKQITECSDENLKSILNEFKSNMLMILEKFNS